jgi:hypothetical protein
VSILKSRSVFVRFSKTDSVRLRKPQFIGQFTVTFSTTPASTRTQHNCDRDDRQHDSVPHGTSLPAAVLCTTSRILSDQWTTYGESGEGE